MRMRTLWPAIPMLGSLLAMGCPFMLGLDDLKGAGDTSGTGAGSSTSTSTSTSTSSHSTGGTGGGGADGGGNNGGGGSTSSSASGGTELATSFGDATDAGIGDQTVSAVAVDSNGHVYVAGSFRGEMKTDCPTPLSSPGNTAGYLLELDPTQNFKCVWDLFFFGSGNVAITALAIDPTNHLTLGGTFNGSFTVPLKGTTLTSVSQDAFVVRYDDHNTSPWATGISGAGDAFLNRVAVDSAGNVFVGGSFTTEVKIGPLTTNAMGGRDAFLFKLNNLDGTLLGSRTFGASGDDEVLDVAAGSSGVVAAGVVTGSANFGSGSQTPPGGQDAFVVVYPSDITTNPQNVTFYGDAANDQRASAVAFGSSGELYVAGTFGGTVDFGATKLANKGGGQDIFLAKLDASWNTTAAIQLAADDASIAGAAALAIDPTSQDILLAGTLQHNVLVANTTSTGDKADDGFVARLASGPGSLLWLDRYTAGMDTELVKVAALALTPAGKIVAAGQFQGSVDFGGSKALTSAGMNDAFVLLLSP